MKHSFSILYTLQGLRLSSFSPSRSCLCSIFARQLDGGQGREQLQGCLLSVGDSCRWDPGAIPGILQHAWGVLSRAVTLTQSKAATAAAILCLSLSSAIPQLPRLCGSPKINKSTQREVKGGRRIWRSGVSQRLFHLSAGVTL